MIARHNFGGTLNGQIGLGFLVTFKTAGAALSFHNIKRRQLDQHRAWALRTMFYMGTIITYGLILVITAVIVSTTGEYRNIWPCEVIDWTWKYYGDDDYLSTPCRSRELLVIPWIQPVQRRFSVAVHELAYADRRCR
jgi:hypothetical protein